MPYFFLLRSYTPIILSITAGMVLASLPLVGYLHFESAFIASITGALIAVWQAHGLRKKKRGDLFRLIQVMVWVYVAALPLLIKDLWIGCFSVDGLGFWIFLPAPSVFFAFSLTRLLSYFKTSYPRLKAVTILLMIGIGGFLIEFFTLPQVMFYNHLWGYWPGPLYDEAIPLGGSLIFYRSLTLCWGLLFWFFPHVSVSKSVRWIFGLAVAGLLLGYLNLSEMGIVRPSAVIQQKLGSTGSTDTFQLYFPRSHIPRKTARYFSVRHEFYYEQIADTLQLDRTSSPDRIQSYIYAHPWQKKRLVGAKFTSYVPVWLNSDQLHIAYPQLSSSLPHELVHVAAKPFGNGLLNASWSIGLVEGLAVALAGNPSSLSTVDQLVAAQTPYPSAEQMRSSLSFLGFYGGRQAVNYTTSGSFIAYLLRNYEVDRFKRAYRTADIPGHYPVAYDSLVAGWHRHLDTVTTDSIDRARRTSLFSIPSIFEQQCPHVISPSEQAWDRYRFLLAERDTSRAGRLLTQVCTESCGNLKIWGEWSRHQLQEGNPERVIEDTLGVSARMSRSPTTALRIADAHFLKGDREKAARWLEKLPVDGNPIKSLQVRRVLKLRSDSMKWSRTASVLYQREKGSRPFHFADQSGTLKAVLMRRWLERNQWNRVRKHSACVKATDIHPLDFEIFVRVGRRLIFTQPDSKTVNGFLDTLKKAASRPRHDQMIRALRRWKTFIKNIETNRRNRL